MMMTTGQNAELRQAFMEQGFVILKGLLEPEVVEQARAAMEGRTYVLPDDVKALAGPVLAHRIVIESSARLRGKSRESVIAEEVAGVPVPIER